MASNRFGYSSSDSIDNFKCLRVATLWAGALGVAQSIIWIALTTTAIISYNCLISVDNKLSYGSLVQTVFLDLYFKGSCNPTDYQGYNSTMLHFVPTVLDSTQLLVWDCVYLAVAVCWLLISVLLLTHIEKHKVHATLAIVCTWVFLTFCISAMDVCLGVIFGIDYSRFNKAAYGFNLSSINAGTIDPNAAQLVAAMVTSLSLMIISFKGFILWIINVGLLCYLLGMAISIIGDKDGNDTLFMPRKDSDDILTTRPPIDAYEGQKTADNAYNNEAFVPDNRSLGTFEVNQESIARAARMSTDASLQDRRFRNLDAFQQYPPPRNNNKQDSTKQFNNRQDSMKLETTVVTATVTAAPFPTPDYSPPMVRANQTQSPNGQMHNQRYQQ